MTKKELVAKVAQKLSFQKKDVEAILNEVLFNVEVSLKNGDTVDLYGFGKFVPTEVKAKEGKVPGSNKTYKTEPYSTTKFRPAKALKKL